MSGLEQKFLKAYANLPEPEREQVIAIIAGKTYSWNNAYREVEAKTILGEQILAHMHEVGIL